MLTAVTIDQGHAGNVRSRHGARRSRTQPLDQSEDSGTSFKDTVRQMLSDTNDKMAAAQQQSIDYATGKTNDVEGTVKSLEEASLAFQLTDVGAQQIDGGLHRSPADVVLTEFRRNAPRRSVGEGGGRLRPSAFLSVKL